MSRRDGTRSRRARTGAHLVGLVLVVGLVATMAIEPTRQLLAQRENVAATAEDLRLTEKANRRLEARIARLRDPDFVEQQAREHIGLVKAGEITYVVMPPARSESGTSRERTRPEARPAVDEPGFVESVLEFVGLTF